MYVDHVSGEWGAFNEIMKRKDLAVQGQVGSLQMKVVAEDKVVEQKTQSLLQEWEREKPIQVCVCACVRVSVCARVCACMHERMCCHVCDCQELCEESTSMCGSCQMRK